MVGRALRGTGPRVDERRDLHPVGQPGQGRQVVAVRHITTTDDSEADPAAHLVSIVAAPFIGWPGPLDDARCPPGHDERPRGLCSFSAGLVMPVRSVRAIRPLK